MPSDTQMLSLESVRALFDGGRLTQARELEGIGKVDLAARLKISAAAIGQFEAGLTRPSVGTLEGLAEALRVPAQFFAGNRPRYQIDEEDAHFRSLRSTSRRDRAQARAQLEMLAEGAAVLDARVRLPAPNVPSVERDASPEDAARVIRRAWRLGTGPIPHVVDLLESHGVVVSRLPAASDTLDAFSSWVGERPFVVLVANKQAADRARFDASHELGHLVFRHRGQPGEPSLERIAHRFAAEFLTPADAIEPLLPRTVDWRRLAQLKLDWGVSMAMLLRQMRDLYAISDDAYKRGMIDMSRRGWRRQEPVTLGIPEEPEMLARAVETLAEQKGYGIEDLARDLSLRRTNLGPFVRVWTQSRRPTLTS